MKVAIVAGPYVPIPPDKYGGTELVIANLVRGLQESGHEPILLASGDSTIDCELVPITEKALYFPSRKKDVPEYEARVAKMQKNTEKSYVSYCRGSISSTHMASIWSISRIFPI